MTRLMNNKLAFLTLALAITAVTSPAHANPLMGALGETKPLLDVRLRYELVDQEPFSAHANATTLRARAGFETGKAWSTALLAEGEFVRAFNNNYNSTVNGQTQLPVVADPHVSQVNRLQFTNTSINNTTITLGRQRINLDDQRFVGNVGWRQNEQTFDALRVVTKPGGKLTIDATYANRVNRVFGEDSAQGAYKGDVMLLNVAYPFSAGKLTGFAYVMEFDPITAVPAALRDSNATYGARFAGNTPLGKTKLSYIASYATQSDYGDNPLNFSNDYYAGELALTYRQWTATAGIESLQGDGVKGFTTPLASLHKFQGWADKFLVTPVNGIEDKYVGVTFLTKKVAPFESMSVTAMYHDYRSTRLGQDYGSENNVQLAAKWQRFTGTLKYAKYEATSSTPLGIGRDTSKFWAQVDFVW